MYKLILRMNIKREKKELSSWVRGLEPSLHSVCGNVPDSNPKIGGIFKVFIQNSRIFTRIGMGT